MSSRKSSPSRRQPRCCASGGVRPTRSPASGRQVGDERAFPWCASGVACASPGLRWCASSTSGGRRTRSVSAERQGEGPGAAVAGLFVTPACRRTRKSLGSTAWAVLEDIALEAEVDDHGRLVVTTNVRRVAAQLGMSKDTVARAFLRLSDAGLVERPSRRGQGRHLHLVGLRRPHRRAQRHHPLRWSFQSRRPMSSFRGQPQPAAVGRRPGWRQAGVGVSPPRWQSIVERASGHRRVAWPLRFREHR